MNWRVRWLPSQIPLFSSVKVASRFLYAMCYAWWERLHSWKWIMAPANRASSSRYARRTLQVLDIDLLTTTNSISATSQSMHTYSVSLETKPKWNFSLPCMWKWLESFTCWARSWQAIHQWKVQWPTKILKQNGDMLGWSPSGVRPDMKVILPLFLKVSNQVMFPLDASSTLSPNFNIRTLVRSYFCPAYVGFCRYLALNDNDQTFSPEAVIFGLRRSSWQRILDSEGAR